MDSGDTTWTLDHPSPSVVHGCVGLSDGRVATACSDTFVRIWEVPTAHCHLLAGHAHAVLHCAVAPDETFLISSSLDRTAKVWDLVTRVCRYTMQHDAFVTCGVFLSSALVATGTDVGDIVLWTVTGVCVGTHHAHAGAIRSVDISADGSMLATAATTVRVWDARMLHLGMLWVVAVGRRRNIRLPPEIWGWMWDEFFFI